MRRRKRERRRPVKKNCVYCAKKRKDSSFAKPAWRDYQNLSEFLSSRGRILPRSLTGVCALHQKQIALAVKQARHLALLPFVS